MFGVFFMLEKGKINITEELNDDSASWRICGNGESDRQIMETFCELYSSNTLLQSNTKIAVRAKREVTVVPVAQVRYITSSNRKLCIQGDNLEIEFYGTLKVIAEKMESLGFVRISKYCIISMNCIKIAGRNKLKMDDGNIVKVGRKYIDNYLEKLKKISTIKVN